MARVVQDVRLNKREQRLRLPVQTKPHWLTINEGEHLGYYRGRRVSKWVARFRLPGASANYVEHRLGEADDVSDADGELILQPLRLTPGESADLETFLRTLSDPGAQKWKPAKLAPCQPASTPAKSTAP